MMASRTGGAGHQQDPDHIYVDEEQAAEEAAEYLDDDAAQQQAGGAAGGDNFDDGDVVSFLQHAGEQYKRHLELLRQEKRQAEMAEVRPIPVICPYESHKMRPKTQIEDRLFRLWEARQDRQAQAREAREAKEAERQQQENTFHPKVSGVAQKLKPRGTQAEITKAFLERHAQRVQQLKDATTQREMQEVLKHPVIAHQPLPGSTTADATTTASDAERRMGLSVQDYLIVKEKERQAKLYRKVEEANTVQGKPRISSRARSMQREGDVVSRLYNPHYYSVAINQSSDENCTFHPKTNAARYEDPLANEPVHERVIMREVKHHSRIGSAANRTPRGRPRISATSEALVRSRREATGMADGGGPSPGSRLYEEGMKKMTEQEVSVMRHQEASKSALRFHPTISANSNKMFASAMRGEACAKTIEAQTQYREKRWKKQQRETQAKLQALREAREKEELKECTFTPSRAGLSPITPYAASAHTGGDASFVERSLAWAHKRERRLDEQRAEKEGVECSNLTFAPQVHQRIPLPRPASHEAFGVASHVERQSRAREQREWQRSQEESGNTPSRHRHPLHHGSIGRSRDFSFQSEALSNRRRREAAQGGLASLRPPVQRADVQYAMLDQSADGDGGFFDGGGSPSHHYGGGMPYTPQAGGIVRTPRTFGAGARGSAGYDAQFTPLPFARYHQQQQQQQYYGEPSEDTSRASYTVHHPPPPPGPVEYLLQTHQNIMRNFQGGQPQPKGAHETFKTRRYH